MVPCDCADKLGPRAPPLVHLLERGRCPSLVPESTGQLEKVGRSSKRPTGLGECVSNSTSHCRADAHHKLGGRNHSTGRSRKALQTLGSTQGSLPGGEARKAGGALCASC